MSHARRRSVWDDDGNLTHVVECRRCDSSAEFPDLPDHPTDPHIGSVNAVWALKLHRCPDDVRGPVDVVPGMRIADIR